MEFVNSKEDIDFLKLLNEMLKENQLPFPELLTIDRLTTIRKELLELMFLWNNIDHGDGLQLVFDAS